MRITGIEIERFGVWEDFSQPLDRSGLTVFYGPNEAGKTTLLRFIRGVLYGFSTDEVPNPKRKGKRDLQSGLLRVEHRGQRYEIRRSSNGEDAGQLSVSGITGADSTTAFMEDLLATTDEKLFESVFAVGLPELQQFATLNADEVASHLYGMTLGPQGRVLMEFPRLAERELNRIASANDGSSLIPTLLKRHDELNRLSLGTTRQRDRYHELLRKKQELSERIEKLRERQSVLQSNLRGIGFMEKVYPPWQRSRECRLELETLPDFSSFPSDGIQRLQRLEQDIDTATRSRQSLIDEIGRISTQLANLRIDPEIRRFSGAVQILSEQRALTRDHEPRIRELERKANDQERELVEHLSALGRNWTLARLDGVDDSPDANGKFLQAAREYQTVLRRTRSFRRRYKKANAASRDREMALRTRLLEHGVSPEQLEGHIDVAAQRIDQLTDIGRWHSEAGELHHRALTVDQQIEQIEEKEGLPDWVYGVLSWFTIAGAALFIAGLYAAVNTSWIVGAIFVLLSVFAAGTAWTFRSHHESQIQEQVALLRDERRKHVTEQRTLLDRIAAYAESCGLFHWFGRKFSLHELNDGDLLTQAAQRAAELQLLQNEYRHVLDVRRKLSVARSRLQLRLRDMANARKSWCQTLSHLGLDETVDVNQAVEHWKRVNSAKHFRQQHLATRAQSQDIRLSYDRFCKQVEDLARRMQRSKAASMGTYDLVDQWESELRLAREASHERKRLRTLHSQRRRESSDWQRKHNTLEESHNALLSLAGVSHRSQLDKRLELMERRRQLEEQLQRSSKELEHLVRSEPNIALVEEELHRFNPNDIAGMTREYKRELDDIEHQLQQLFEQSGTVKQEMKSLEADRRSLRVRREMNQVETELRDSWQSWFAASLTQDAIQDVATQFEQANQPEMLAAAIPFLRKLTLGKYHHLWTPLGRKHLFVDELDGESRPAEKLSGGTREQLFLAIRLAMVKAFSKNGIELPMVLDDVTVNFDEHRSEAAADTLLDFTREGQQMIVLTSHIHYAEMFQARGIKPIYLPNRNLTASGERRAG